LDVRANLSFKTYSLTWEGPEGMPFTTLRNKVVRGALASMKNPVIPLCRPDLWPVPTVGTMVAELANLDAGAVTGLQTSRD
jgi:hypothetical protein